MNTDYPFNQDANQEINDFNNIISINSNEDIDDMLDFDFDYDVNEMYYALNGTN